MKTNAFLEECRKDIPDDIKQEVDKWFDTIDKGYNLLQKKTKIMSWASVTGEKRKPLMWWYHKILCEIGYSLRNQLGLKMYYKHLDALCKHGFNLYGEKIWN